jgi:NuA3 HAT complex component NTO1
METVLTPVAIPEKRGRGRPRKHPLPPGTEPPPKKKRTLGPSGLFATARPSRRHTEGPRIGTSTPHNRVRHDGDLRYSSAAAAASAMSQNDTYKPREERSWEEFHPDLDLDVELPAFNADDVDAPLTPGASGVVNTPGSQTGTPVPGQYFVTPMKKRGPGRPPKRPEALLFSMGSPNQKIAPVPLHNPKEKLVLPKPTFRRINTFASYEKSSNISINYVEKNFANAGYQESEIFVQTRTLIRGGKSAVEDEHEASLNTDIGDGSSNSHAKVRVEYDMDEQDERFLEVINAERAGVGADAIRPQHFEIAMTLIEKEWHALERSKSSLRIYIDMNLWLTKNRNTKIKSKASTNS